MADSSFHNASAQNSIQPTQSGNTPVQIQIPYSANHTFDDPSVQDFYIFSVSNQTTYTQISIHSDVTILMMCDNSRKVGKNIETSIILESNQDYVLSILSNDKKVGNYSLSITEPEYIFHNYNKLNPYNLSDYQLAEGTFPGHSETTQYFKFQIAIRTLLKCEIYFTSTLFPVNFDLLDQNFIPVNSGDWRSNSGKFVLLSTEDPGTYYISVGSLTDTLPGVFYVFYTTNTTHMITEPSLIEDNAIYDYMDKLLTIVPGMTTTVSVNSDTSLVFDAPQVIGSSNVHVTAYTQVGKDTQILLDDRPMKREFGLFNPMNVKLEFQLMGDGEPIIMILTAIPVRQDQLDEFELGNSQTTAVPMLDTSMTSYSIDAPNDTDWFAIDSIKGYQYDIFLTGNLCPTIGISNGNITNTFSFPGYFNYSLTDFGFKGDGTIHYFEVLSASPTNGACKTYSIYYHSQPLSVTQKLRIGVSYPFILLSLFVIGIINRKYLKMV